MAVIGCESNGREEMMGQGFFALPPAQQRDMFGRDLELNHVTHTSLICNSICGEYNSKNVFSRSNWEILIEH